MIISIEGGDGLGKSTQAELLYKKLKEKGYDVEKVHFPRYSSLAGNIIHDVLFGKIEMDPRNLQQLYVIDQLLFQTKILKANKDKIFIFDRYDLSTICYYKLTTKKELLECLITIYKNMQNDLVKPDMTFILTSNNADIQKERIGTDENFDIFEKNHEIKEKISDTYIEVMEGLSLYYGDTRQVCYVNADKEIEEISNEMLKHLHDIKLLK